MPTKETLGRFLARVESNAHADAIAELRTESASMRANPGEPRVGRGALVAGERRVPARAEPVDPHRIGPVLVNGDFVAVRWTFRFERPDGSTTVGEKLACPRREGGRIAEEQFFHDPAQHMPRKAAG